MVKNVYMGSCNGDLKGGLLVGRDSALSNLKQLRKNIFLAQDLYEEWSSTAWAATGVCYANTEEKGKNYSYSLYT